MDRGRALFAAVQQRGAVLFETAPKVDEEVRFDDIRRFTAL